MSPSLSHDIKLRPDESLDVFMDGRLKLIQSKNGYRFSMDAVLLSQFVSVRKDDVVIDLGTGCGVILLILLFSKHLNRTYGLEIQKELADQAVRNASLNGYKEKMKIIHGDMRHLPFRKGCADFVICNPPYRKDKSGRINPDKRRAIARHEILVSVDEILKAARYLLKKRGRFALIYPGERLVDILARLRRFNLEPKKLQINYPGHYSGGKLALIETCLGARPGLEICTPLIGQGNFSI
jgi:tRNA1Val (adenine37-N6)-methyltransferase